MSNINHFYFFLLLLCISDRCIGQFENKEENKGVISEESLSKIERNMNSMNENIGIKTIKMLSVLQRQEIKLKEKLAFKDSVTAKTLFVVNDAYGVFIDKIKNSLPGKNPGVYIPELDSLKTGLLFLEQTKSLQHMVPKEWVSTITGVTKSIDGVRNKLDQTVAIKNYIKERKLLLKEQFEKYGMTKELRKLGKEFNYFEQQISEFRSMLKDRKKVETRMLAELRNVPAFTEFMKKNSQIAQLFRLPGNGEALQNGAGLQTRAS